MNLGVFIARRLALSALVLVGITLVTFGVSHAVPGDPIAANLGERAQENPAIIAQYRHNWGLDQSLPIQYGLYIRNLLHGDLGVSITTRRPVSDDLRQFFPATIELSTAAMLFAVLIGVPLGILAAVRRNRVTDH